MFRKNITVMSAKKVVDAVKALANTGDIATAEVLRKWFNATFRGFAISTVLEGKRIMGYRLESECFGTEIREVAVKCPGTKRVAQIPAVSQTEGTAASAEVANRLTACFEDE